MNFNSQHLIVFTKNPEEGKVKTRLAKSIGFSKALTIHNALCKKTIDVVRKVNAQKSLYYTEYKEENSIWTETCENIHTQKGKDLGERMSHALQDSFHKSFKKTLIIGTDLWDLTVNDIHTAFDALENNDIVIGPAQDGGYYLIGMKKPQPNLFKQIDWGKENVLKDTLEKCKGKKVFLLEEKNDIDEFKDLEQIEALKILL